MIEVWAIQWFLRGHRPRVLDGLGEGAARSMLPSSFMRTSRLGSLGLFLLLAACGSGGGDATGAPARPNGDPAGSTPPSTPSAPASPADHGAVSTTYPAFKPDFAMLKNKGGKVLTNPVFVTVVWDDNPNAATYEQLADTIGTTKYWKEIVGEYGVGVASSGAANHVREKTPIPLSSSPNADPVDAIVTFMQEKLKDTATSKWPAPTDQTVYSLFLAGEAAQKICNDGAGGLHESFTLNGKEVAFALILECNDGPGGAAQALQEATISASHELGEAAVDPYPETGPAWQGVDDDHLAWELMQMGQDENADLCELYEDAYGKVSPEMPFFVQRQWSNASALGGHAPCVPQGESPYFNVAPLAPADTLTIKFPSGFDLPFNPTSKGFKVAVGETRTIPLGFYSDAATEPFSVEAFEVDAFDEQGEPMKATSSPNMELSLDKTTGQNGEKTYLTVKMNKMPSVSASLVLVSTTLGKTTHMMPFLIGPGADAASAAPGGGSTGANKKSSSWGHTGADGIASFNRLASAHHVDRRGAAIHDNAHSAFQHAAPSRGTSPRRSPAR